MRIPSNHIKSVIQFFFDELKDLYTREEIDNFIFFSFQYYLNFSRIDLTLKTSDTISESDLLKLNAVVKRLKREEPIQYILGEAWFFDLSFKVNPSVLIPRPETEELVDWVIKEVQLSNLEACSILDIGTGSACIPIALKKKLPNTAVSALDISVEALEVAKQNAEFHNVDIRFIQADILRPISSTSATYSIIVSNPPYVLLSEKELMKPNVVAHEPHLALFVNDDDPLKFYKSIIEFAKFSLTPNGKLFFEINELKSKELKKYLIQNGFTKVEIKKDINGKARMVKGER